MHQCVKHEEIKFSTWCKKPRRQRQEEVSCSVCRDVFCCERDREKHEEVKHGWEAAGAARQQRQTLNERRPLVCLNCCQVFVSALFINDYCTNVSGFGNNVKAFKTTHVLITIPEWAVDKYLVPHQNKKRSWDKSNEGVAEVEIMIHPAEDKSTEGNSLSQKTNIQSILSKQRKTDLAEKRNRRVTFSPVTAVALTSRLSIVKVESQKTNGESSSDSSPQLLLKTPKPSIRNLQNDRSHCEATEYESAAEYESAVAFTPSVQNHSTDNAFSPTEPNAAAAAGSNNDCVFSPPLPDGGTNGSPLMTPQMSSTPVNENSERKTQECLSDQEISQEAAPPDEGIFSSLANIICCAFQALPSVLTHFFSLTNEIDHKDEPSSSGRHRRQRRRSATFTPYAPVSKQKRKLNRRKRRPLSPIGSPKRHQKM